ncbi:MAG: DUF2905 domain-containing protein [Parvularculaceae bacterium]
MAGLARAVYVLRAMTQRTLIIAGAAILLVGLLWPWISKLGLGRLPGDIVIRREGVTFYFPVTTMILASVVATALWRMFGK